MTEDNTFIIKGPRPLQPIPNVSLGKILFDKLLSNFIDDPALVDAADGQSMSYKELLLQTCSLAETFRKLGYGKNTVITICCENTIDFFIPVIAALYIGATIAPINHNYTVYELIYTLKISKPEIIFCSKNLFRKLHSLIKELKVIKKVIIMNRNNTSSKINLGYYLNMNRLESSDLPNFEVSEVQSHDQIAFIMCSSGTTGLPKGVMLTHNNVLTTFMHTEDPRILPQQEGRSTIGLLPFFHAYGLIRTLNGIYKLMKIIVMKKFDEELFLSTIEKYKVTTLALVPPLAVFLSKSPLVEKYDLSSVAEATCGAAPLSKDTEELLKHRLNIKCLRQGYGLTETTLSLVGMPFAEQRFGSSGKLYPYILCKVRDPETGRSLGPNQVGELCFKGPLIMKGYYNNEEATKNAFTSDGWFLTGDLGYYDDDEYFYVVDRLKELIKFKGFQVAPAELEAILLTNPDIQDAGVIGIPIGNGDELPLAFVVKNSNANISERDVQKYVKARVSYHKRLRGGVIFVSEIPKNPSGKILRRKLRELVLKQKSKL